MQAKSELFAAEHSNTALLALAVIFGLLALGLETVLDVPVKLPGHRAFPGALALLVFAEAFAPLLVVGLAAAVSIVLATAGGAGPLVIGVWLVATAVIYAISRTKLRGTLIAFLIGGLAFGALRVFSESLGFHHTPGLVRLAGHLGFGCLGALVAYGAVRLTRRNTSA